MWMSVPDYVAGLKGEAVVDRCRPGGRPGAGPCPVDRMTDDTLLDIRDPVVRFGERTVVNGVGICVARGETGALVGESGSGKSLTARAVLGLLRTGATATGSARRIVESGSVAVVSSIRARIPATPAGGGPRPGSGPRVSRRKRVRPTAPGIGGMRVIWGEAFRSGAADTPDLYQ